MDADASLTTQQKALALNLDPATYGGFAEIGGGQEVARWFFSVGSAATGVAKAISAYDMAVSDALYGPAQRYVSRQRLEAMLEHELTQLIQQLGPRRGDTTTFFVFANTVATRSHGRVENGHGWMGVRFQARPHDSPSEIVLHVHLLDESALHEKEALGILGVNLLYGAFYQRATPGVLIGALVDDLSRRVEIDMISFAGPAFAGIDNRLMALQLVQHGLTDAAMFRATGDVVQPSDVLHRKPILIERGSFRPATKLTLDLLEQARQQFVDEPTVRGQEPVVLAEMTLRSLSDSPDVGHLDFLARADILGALGLDVLISRFEPYYQVAEYLARYTDRPIGMAVGLPSVRQIADEKYFTDLPGGVLESAGRLFRRSVKMYVYPTRDPATRQIHSVDRAPLSPPWPHLRDLLIEIGRIEPIRHYDETYLSIHTPDVRHRIETGDPSWEEMVSPVVADMIKTKKLFGYRTTDGRQQVAR
ncbi:MAG TPA: TonB-dependent receptor [Methylomirabilota bacterium]|nr:TonB-dependent receptor [Methylomirabilota bacterium]